MSLATELRDIALKSAVSMAASVGTLVVMGMAVSYVSDKINDRKFAKASKAENAKVAEPASVIVTE